jgi:MFS family permease
MAANAPHHTGADIPHIQEPADTYDGKSKKRLDWTAPMSRLKARKDYDSSQDTSEKKKSKWSMGMLDAGTDEVPGSVLLLSKVSEYNEPLGMRNVPARTSVSSFPLSPGASSRRPSTSGGSSLRQRWRARKPEKKMTADGKFVLEPQPDDTPNDPLNWSVWRRDAALLSLGFYCMVGGGMTPILAAGFSDVGHDFNVSHAQVALTTGLYMMGLGLGSVVLSPTAILYGKRPVYLVAAICFVLSAIWCALSPTFISLLIARIFQGFAVSSVECLPSATVAEIYFLHEKAYRLGIYTLLLLGGKNLVPLVSAAIIQSLGWRWVFWMVAIIVGFGFTLLFFFVPETFWDRTPLPHKSKHRLGSIKNLSNVFKHGSRVSSPGLERKTQPITPSEPLSPSTHHEKKHARFAGDEDDVNEKGIDQIAQEKNSGDKSSIRSSFPPTPQHKTVQPDYFNHAAVEPKVLEEQGIADHDEYPDPRNEYTRHHLHAPPKTFSQSMRPYSGRLSPDKWLKVAIRPFILFAYPSILWSALVYSLSIGWLIVLSESIADIYIQRDTYNFTALQAGLVYISPFIGGVLGTAVAGKVSDMIVRYLARRNGGVYEPEFRLVMAIPIAITTVIGLMGYGWSAQNRDLWIVPTVFFGFISFGCSLGSTTAITFAVDSYRQYAGEALVTLNFSKNIFHGLIFSLFFNHWLESDGSKDVFIALGGIQLACLFSTIPMYMYGKRARLWTVRKNLMEKF